MDQNYIKRTILEGIWESVKKVGFREKSGPLIGALDMELRGPDGRLLKHVRKNNLIVNAGFDLICDAIGASSGRPNVVSHIGVGTSATAAAAAQTALITQHADGRLAATYAHTAGTKVFTMTVACPAGTWTGALTEAGVFNAASAGSMLDRVVFSVINKGAGDTLTPTFTFTFS